MNFSKNEIELANDIITERVLSRQNKVRQYFAPYFDLLGLRKYIYDKDELYLFEDKVYVPLEPKDDVYDQVLDVYDDFKVAGAFDHIIQDGYLYAGVEVPPPMLKAFIQGKYHEMYDPVELRLVYTDEFMLQLFNHDIQYLDISQSRANLFFLRKVIYYLTDNKNFTDQLEAKESKPKEEEELLVIKK